MSWKTTHGRSKSTEYRIWASMKGRCEAPSSRTIRTAGSYSLKGIKVCERWQRFENFFEDMGPRPPGMTLDRIDGNRDYEPTNCRWATPVAQNNNRGAFNSRLTFNGRTLTISEWARETGISATKLYQRVYRGESLDRCFIPGRLPQKKGGRPRGFALLTPEQRHAMAMKGTEARYGDRSKQCDR